MKKRTKKVMSMLLVAALTAGISISGTMAYLTSEDSDVNVMTLGNVKIEQHEYQRATDEDGSFKKDTIDGENSYVLEDFEQGKPLLPIVGDPSSPEGYPYAGYDETIIRMTQVDSYGSVQVFAGKNAQDKIVTVENTGKSDAYVRTIVALEVGEANADLIGLLTRAQSADSKGNQPWIENPIGTVNINGNNYYVYEYVYCGASDVPRHLNGVLPAGATTYPNLCQVYIGSEATNEDCEALDGNNNGTYDILVLSQAVQAAGFSDAQTALDTAFGDVTVEKAAEWLGDVRPVVMVEGNDKDAVENAIEKAESGYKVTLTENVTIAGNASKLIIDKDIVLDLNGYTITTEGGWGGIDLKGGASIINGTINHTGNTAAIKAFAVDKIEDVTINVTATEGKIKGDIVVQNNSDNYVNTIKNVTITGATNGIECYCSIKNPAIGTIENIKIDATENGIWLNGAGVIGKISNSEIKGGNIGINAYVANLWNIALDIENSTISGGVSGIDIWDEAETNTGSTVTLIYDDATTFKGDMNNIKVTLGEEITCTINGEEP